MKKKYNFYIVSHGGLADPFWQPVKKGMEIAADLLDVKATYICPEEKYSINALVNNLERVIATKPDGIAVTITNIRFIEEPLKRAISQGIPIIAINVPDFRPINERIPYLFYIGMDEYVCGKRLAERILDGFTPKRAVIGIHEEDHKGLEKRAKGIKNVFRKRNIPTDKLYITTNPTLAIKKFKEYREEHPETDVIFTLGPLGTEPALNFLEEKNLVGKVKLATVDRLPRTTDDINRGKIVCTAEQGPYLQGFLPILWFYQYYKYQYYKNNVSYEDILLGPFIVDKYNIAYIEHMEKIVEELNKSLNDKDKKKFKNKFREVWNSITKHKEVIDIILKIIISIVRLWRHP